MAFNVSVARTEYHTLRFSNPEADLVMRLTTGGLEVEGDMARVRLMLEAALVALTEAGH